MTHWIEDLRQLAERGEPAFMVTVAHVRGSAPRESGAKMLVTASELAGTIGGGQLEYQCTRIACDGLRGAGEAEAAQAFIRRFPLGASCGQCCGGVAEILFEKIDSASREWISDLAACYRERIPAVVATSLQDARPVKHIITQSTCRNYKAPVGARHASEFASAFYKTAAAKPPADAPAEPLIHAARDIITHGGHARRFHPGQQTGTHHAVLLEPVMTSRFNLALFGAGHVGSAVVAAMSGLDCNVRWIDSRRGVFPQRLPSNVVAVESENPAQEAAAMPPGSYYLVMTHSHALDFDICSRVLARDDIAWCGLIGSVSKRRRFEKLMRKQGMAETVLERLTCPIGVPGIDSRTPQAIAIGVAAQLLQERTKATANRAEPRGNVHVLRG